MEDEKRANSPPSEQAFDPFGDRIARDIRNTLSEAFVEAWKGGAAYEPLAECLESESEEDLPNEPGRSCSRQ